MAKQFTYRKLDIYDLGTVDYKMAWDIQKDLFEKRINDEINDCFILLEHPHTYTLGKVADRNNLLFSQKELEEKEISVYDIDRGGDITYHGPGQIVGYPIINLSDWFEDTHKYLRSLEQVIINVCGEYGLNCGRNEKYTGVWLHNRKICAIGIKIRKWVTMHGFAFNIQSDLKMFNGIIPCGITDKEVTSLEKELDRKVAINEVKEKIKKYFIDEFSYEAANVEVKAKQLLQTKVTAK
ncbi:MAG: lipoyl(octanoyl) transferase LipB [Ignavibacteria bacterium]|jgi:lipoyl(octanoyl) transferase